METDLHLVVTAPGCADDREVFLAVRNALALNGMTVLELEVIPPTTSVRVYRDTTIRAGHRALPEDVPQRPRLMSEDRPVTHDRHCERGPGRSTCLCIARGWQ